MFWIFSAIERSETVMPDTQDKLEGAVRVLALASLALVLLCANVILLVALVGVVLGAFRL